MWLEAAAVIVVVLAVLAIAARLAIRGLRKFVRSVWPHS
jgi:ABC-type phosphate transport system auxiliary subunit